MILVWEFYRDHVDRTTFHVHARGAPINVLDKFGQTPLFRAAGNLSCHCELCAFQETPSALYIGVYWDAKKSQTLLRIQSYEA